MSRPSTLLRSPPTPPCPSPTTSAWPYRRGYPAGEPPGDMGVSRVTSHGCPCMPPLRRRGAGDRTPVELGHHVSLRRKRSGSALPRAPLTEGSDVTTLHVGSLALRPAGLRRLPRSLRRTASEQMVTLPPRAPRYRAEQATARTGLSPVSHGPSSAHSLAHGFPTAFTVRHAQAPGVAVHTSGRPGAPGSRDRTARDRNGPDARAWSA